MSKKISTPFLKYAHTGLITQQQLGLSHSNSKLQAKIEHASFAHSVIMNIEVEYLTIIPKSNSFCDSTEAFGRLLQVDSKITIKNGKLSYNDEFKTDYAIAGGEVTDKDQRYFQLRLTCSTNESKIDEDVKTFTELLKRIRGAIAKVDQVVNIEVLWDDISALYSKRAYAQIHEIESLMRKLIANFMLVTVGKEWVKEASPSEIQEAISKSKRKDYVNVLHSIDFIHLADFLLRPYSRTPIQELYRTISKSTTQEELLSLKSQVPLSNWERYFSNLVNCEDTFLKKRWEDLYELRCRVAHNALVTAEDLQKITELSSELKTILKEAIDRLPRVSVPNEERELIAESAASSINALFGGIVIAWRELEEAIRDKYIDISQDTAPNQVLSTRARAETLYRENIISKASYFKIHELYALRNEIVHGKGNTLAAVDLDNYTKNTNLLIDEIAPPSRDLATLLPSLELPN
ncbi:HEPN domain-containing protein [Azohydromonas lata]|uniref:HEPN domain-containing protein n=1 Tax=Azohydromonas lata TaxID=45677 RepID=A0ABU5IHH6_9BURK|nr:HEPN domain-containing protein [Azohydromonas lata]MDZ5458605.1 HEPN domain-containing protein [Azohydromonas lata]